jgi:glucosamine--fructose-6-phosphate aminotransferase (isomerizing)
MCGIVGYIGGQNAVPILMEGLFRLEYRGYDSAGIAIVSAKGTQVFRRVGRVRELEAALPRRLSGKTGIGHTRWATHGPVTQANAHPQVSEDGRIAVVHNGILDNAMELREELIAKGEAFSSETDTEVVAHLIANSAAGTLEEAVLEALGQITGTYAFAVLDQMHPDRIVVARNGSPLILGVGDREMFVASDLSALVRHTTSVVHLDDGELATVTAAGFRTFSRERENTAKQPVRIELEADDVELSGHQHYMRKEIFEQPGSVERMLRGRLDERFGTARLDGLNLGPRDLRGFRRVKILGCGSAYYVGQIGAQLIEELARMPADAEAASEFRYRNPVIEPDTLYVAVSQSGETADTAFAVREVKRKGGQVVGLVNVVGSTIARDLPACWSGDRGRLDQGPDAHGDRLRDARAGARPGPRPVDHRRAAHRGRPEGPARTDRGGALRRSEDR